MSQGGEVDVYSTLVTQFSAQSGKSCIEDREDKNVEFRAKGVIRAKRKKKGCQKPKQNLC